MKTLSHQSRVAELGDVANRLVRLYQKNKAVQKEEYLKEAFEQLQKYAEGITLAVNKGKASSALEKADKQRDYSLRVLDRLLKAYVMIPIEDLQLKGKRLWRVFSRYGMKITNENYSVQSNLIDSLLLDLSDESLQDAIADSVGVTEAIAGIRKAQEEFAQARSEYENERSLLQGKAAASSFRKETLELLNKNMLPYLWALRIGNAARYGTFVGEAFAVVDSVNLAIKAREKNKKPTPPTKPSEEPIFDITED